MTGHGLILGELIPTDISPRRFHLTRSFPQMHQRTALQCHPIRNCAEACSTCATTCVVPLLMQARLQANEEKKPREIK